MIRPEYINQLIDFYPNAKPGEWKFDIHADDMRNVQIRGAAHIYNLLKKHKIALLADEVGMGKTIQTLSVITALLHEKPDAKILILVPRREVVNNWNNEYNSFIHQHYRHYDNIIKASIGRVPTKELVNCSDLYNLTHYINQGWPQLFIGKISSFSYLLKKSDIENQLSILGIRISKSIEKLINEYQKISTKNNSNSKKKIEIEKILNVKIVELLRKQILSKSNTTYKPYFDLVVIDEAHYFRNKDGNSFRVKSAETFFGSPDSTIRLADKVLLLTATPNHSSSNDIVNITAYFTSKFENKEYKEILNTICVRRLRKLGINSLNKYNYRKEIETPSTFKDNPLSEMFFALYQHDLVLKINNTVDKKGKRNYGMMKYLEGVEFIPSNIQSNSTNDTKGNDYSVGEDFDILHQISKKYKSIFLNEPSHPKYDKLIDDINHLHPNEKMLIFVRRIASVTEISRRYISEQDSKLWQYLAVGNLKKIKISSLTRKSFNRYNDYKVKANEELINSQDIADANGFDNNDDSNNGNIPTSKVLDLFKTLKSGSKSTDASNFRLRFGKSKQSYFSLFFSPAADYFNEPYHNIDIHHFEGGDYYFSTALHRINSISDDTIKNDLCTILIKNKQTSSHKSNDTIKNLLIIFWEILNEDTSIDNNKKEQILHTYNSYTPYEKEALSNFIQKGTLFASESIVWMYQIFKEIYSENSSQFVQYNLFVSKFKQILPSKRLYQQIQDSILFFKTIYSKVITFKNDKELVNFDWNIYDNAQPIYPYSADNKNKSVLNAFNTPFFPDVLVATSVLQESVNLQYFCKHIYHYGMAWTPGDNEQRIGRIDRMFGKIERDINENIDPILPIYYPFLKDTVDESNLSNFIIKKYKEESLIDSNKGFIDNENFNFIEPENYDWQQYLRKQPSSEKMLDPYPVTHMDFKNINVKKYEPNIIDIKPIFESIINAIKDLSEYNSEIYFVNSNNEYKIIVNPILKGKRYQPLIIEASYDFIGSGALGKPVYCLYLKTPLSTTKNIDIIRNGFRNDFEIQKGYVQGVKLCFDKTVNDSSNWGIYFSYELPLFLKELKINPLSLEEIKYAFITLVEFADLTERALFSNQDLKLNDINLTNLSKNNDLKNRNHLRKATNKYQTNWKKRGDYVVLEKVLPNDGIDFKNSLIINHEKKFIKLYFKNEKMYKVVSHYHMDIQKDEIELLECHFDL